jgi:hypothetical protein
VIAVAEKCKLAVLIHSQWTHEIKEFTVVDYVVEGDLGSLMQFAKLVADAEREACAKACYEEANKHPIGLDSWWASTHCAQAIEARGQA